MSGLELGAGTSGFSYDAWKGVFYPEGLSAKKRLGYYASQLTAVEINNTFYRMPRRSVLEGWAEQVPESFRFAIKASRRITHFKRLKDAGEETGYLLDVTSALGERLGALLFQLPPNLPYDADRLAAFLELLPQATPAAFEFRHPSWAEAGASDLLAERGFATVGVDSDEADLAQGALEAGPGLAYLRLRRAEYQADDLLGLAERLVASTAERALVFFKHEDAGAGPRLASRFQSLVSAQAERRKPVRAKRKATDQRRDVKRGA